MRACVCECVRCDDDHRDCCVDTNHDHGSSPLWSEMKGHKILPLSAVANDHADGDGHDVHNNAHGDDHGEHGDGHGGHGKAKKSKHGKGPKTHRQIVTCKVFWKAYSVQAVDIVKTATAITVALLWSTTITYLFDAIFATVYKEQDYDCLLYTSPSPRDRG